MLTKGSAVRQLNELAILHRSRSITLGDPTRSPEAAKELGLAEGFALASSIASRIMSLNDDFANGAEEL